MKTVILQHEKTRFRQKTVFNNSNMRYLLSLLLLLMCAPLSPSAQNLPEKSPQQKITRMTPAKKDTSSAEKQAIRKFSTESMYTAVNPKPTTPEEAKAQEYFAEGAKKGKAGEYAAAVIEFTKSLDLVKNANTYVLRANAFLLMKNYGAAQVDATEALKMQPAYLKAYLVRGIARYEGGNRDGARADLEVYLDQDRTEAEAFNYMAAICYMSNDFKGALENYNEVVRINPKYKDIYSNRGMMRHQLGDYKGAILDYGEALKINPQDLAALSNRGAAYMMMDEMDNAMTDLNMAIALNPGFADAYAHRGLVKQALGDMTGACEDWNQAYTNGSVSARDLIVKFCK